MVINMNNEGTGKIIFTDGVTERPNNVKMMFTFHMMVQSTKEVTEAGTNILFSVDHFNFDIPKEQLVQGCKPRVTGTDLVNAHQPAMTTIKGKKIWQDHHNQDDTRPRSITVHLLANGKEIQTKLVTAADNWKYSFGNLPLYQAGKKINYTINEDAVKGYK